MRAKKKMLRHYTSSDMRPSVSSHLYTCQGIRFCCSMNAAGVGSGCGADSSAIPGKAVDFDVL